MAVICKLGLYILLNCPNKYVRHNESTPPDRATTILSGNVPFLKHFRSTSPNNLLDIIDSPLAVSLLSLVVVNLIMLIAFVCLYNQAEFFFNVKSAKLVT